VAYQYKNNRALKAIDLHITGSGNGLKGHVLLPQGASVTAVTAGTRALPYKTARVENSNYVDFDLALPFVQKVIIQYQ